jgi:translation initiation factor IF-3
MVKIQEQYIINGKGQRTGVILPIEKYEELLEDLRDLVVIAERRDEPVISFDKLKERLRENGIL